MAALLGLVAGCDSVLDVEPPDRLPAEQLDDPSTAVLQVNSVVASLDCAFAQYITTTGEVADEFVNSNLASVQAFDFDARRVTSDQENYSLFDCESFNAIYLPLSVALSQAAEVLERLQAWSDAEVPGRVGLLATTLAYAAYGRVLLGEAFCSAAIEFGPELTSEEIFLQAEQLFGEAIQAAQQAGDESVLNLARVGRARVRHNLGDLTGALADAEEVPAGFERTAHYSSASTRSMNHVFRANNQTNFESVGPEYRNLEYGGVPDPRVRAVNTGQLGSGRVFQVWHQLKYASLDAEIPLASWDEAQLIIAEIEGGQRAVEIINAFHGAAGLPEFQSQDEGEILAHVIQERARELFLEGHRFWDMRRLELDLVPPPGTAYPKGGFYGDMRCFPLPDVERNNNPNI